MIDTTILLSFCYAPCCLCQFIVVEEGFLLSHPLTTHLYVKPTMTNLWKLLVQQLSVWWLPVWCFLFGIFQISMFSIWLCWLMVLVWWWPVPWFCHSWLYGIRFCCGGFDSSGFQGIGFGCCQFGSCQVQAALGTSYWCCWNHQCHQDCRKQCCQTQCGKSHRFVHAISGRCHNQPT